MEKHSETHPVSHWRRLIPSLFARPRPIHLLMGLLFLVFGLALVTQVRAQQVDPLDSLSEPELVELLADLDNRSSSLEAQKNELTAQLDDLSAEADQLAVAQDAAQRLQNQAEIAAGLVPVSGPGIVMGIADPGGSLTASVFVTTLAELRNAGAEAIEVGGNRLTLRSWFADDNGSIVVDGVTLDAPYTWRVIGDPDTLATGMEIRGGAAAQLRAYGATVTIDRSETVNITSVAARFVPKWATVAEE